MTSPSPKISVVLSVYNGGKYLHESVHSILNQAYSNYEFIIINDGSTDETKTILDSISDHRVNIIHQENKGLTSSLNRALSLSKGEYIARHDADDVSLPDRLIKQIEFLENNKDYVLTGSFSYMINGNDEHIGIYKLPKTDTEIRWNMLFRNPLCHSTVMIRGDILRNQNLKYNESLKTAQDYELWSRIMKMGKMSNNEEPLVKYRIHAGQLCQVQNTEQQMNALSISQSNLANLGFHLSEDEALVLRKWAYGFPSDLQKKDLHYCEILFDIFNTFRHQPYIDEYNYKAISKEYAWMFCNAINKVNMVDVMFSSVFRNIFIANGMHCCKNFGGRLIKKLIH